MWTNGLIDEHSFVFAPLCLMFFLRLSKQQMHFNYCPQTPFMSALTQQKQKGKALSIALVTKIALARSKP